jgi:hypothetical protein
VFDRLGLGYEVLGLVWCGVVWCFVL